MRRILIFQSTLLLLLCFSCGSVWAEGYKIITGFYMPTGKLSGFEIGGTFLEGGGDPGFPGDYFPGEEVYHLGYDIGADEGDSVYAIADGLVIYKSENGWGENNCCLVIKHRLHNGEYFLAFYGHIKTSGSKNVNDTVDVNETIGEIGHYTYGDHLHFGVHPGNNIPSSPWGKEDIADWASTGDNGFVDPIEFLFKTLPYGATSEEINNLNDCMDSQSLCGPPYSTSQEYYSIPGTDLSSPPPYCYSCNLSGERNGGGVLPTDYTDDVLPDFSNKETWLTGNSDGSGVKYTYFPGEQAYVCSITKNGGDADSPSDIKVMFLHSNGYNKDSHSEWYQVGDLENIRYYNMEVGEEKEECTGFNVSSTPGVYNIVACADRTEESDNGDGDVIEKHESNNCSTEAVFYVIDTSSSGNQFLADVNGDGLDDAVVFYDDDSHNGEWWVATANSSGYFENLSLWASWVGVDSTERFLADVNGDGKADVVMYYDNASHPSDWYVALATASNTFEYTGNYWASQLGVGSEKRFLGDVDGDGKADVVMYYDNATHPSDWFVALATASNTFAYTGTVWASYLGVDSANQLLGDVNGDGKDDVVLYYENATHPGKWFVGLATASGTFNYTGSEWISWFGVNSKRQFLADVNGDGFADAVTFYDNSNNPGEWYAATANAGGYFNSFSLWASQVGIDSNNQMLGDVDGDGKDDATLFYDTPANPGAWWIAPANPSTSQFINLSLWALWVGADS